MAEFNIKLPREVEYIIERLNLCGFRADIVGGCVRDTLLGKTPTDYDITTSASPEEIKEVFKGEKIVETGIAHGTVTLVLKSGNYEITTYRIDGEYKDNRHPVSVSFTKSIENDLARRDFTVNAMAYNKKDGITDLFCGMGDLKKGVIRAVGEAKVRFSEDALRILRAVRFASVLGFEVEEKTAEAARLLKGNLKGVSRERITAEWRKLLEGEGSYRVISLFGEVIKEVIPQLTLKRLPDEDIWQKFSGREREIYLFALYSDKAGYICALKDMKSDNERLKFGASVLEIVENPPGADEKSVAQTLIKYGEEVTDTAFRIGEAINAVPGDIRKITEKFKSKKTPVKVSDLDISGREIISVGASGEAVGKILNALLLSAAVGEIENRREVLISEAEKLVKSI